MAVLSVVKYPNPVLTTRTAPVESIDAELRALVADMVETMYAAQGVGLAANQVGVAKQLAVIDIHAGEGKDGVIVLINPEIIETEGSITEEEGCLSFPGITELVARPERVVARALNLEGKVCTLEGRGLLARALCHEVDHLNGVLFMDRLTGIKKERVRKQVRESVRSGEWEAVHP